MNGLTKLLITLLLLLGLWLSLIACGPKEEETGESDAADNGGATVSETASETEEDGPGLNNKGDLDGNDYGPIVRV